MDGNTKKEELAGFLSRLLRRKVKERPLSAQEWFQVGFSIMHSSSDYEKAIGAFSSCIQMDSSNARAFLCRGISYECINNMDSAVADYTKAIALLPEDGKAYYMRGMSGQLGAINGGIYSLTESRYLTVPEPTTMALVLLGGMGLLAARRKSK